VDTEEEADVIRCIDCGQSADESGCDIVTLSNENAYCTSCLNCCDSCGEWYMYISASHWFIDICGDCQDDHFACGYCDSTTHFDDSVTSTDGGATYCSSCADRHWSYCGECSEWYEDNSNDECSDAYRYGINDYSFKPTPIFHYTPEKPSKTFFGFELEVEAVHETISTGVDIVRNYVTDDLVYLKGDGSLNDGFEIVTHPMTHDWAMEKFPWEMIEKLRRSGYRSWDTDTCGLHVHASRTSFVDRSHLWKWTYLINKNNRECIELAGRNSHYAQFYGVKPTSDIVLKKAMPRERYVAINLNPTHTVEVRIFRGSLRIPRVKTALDFMQSTIEFANKLTIKEASAGNTWGMFKDYVGEHSHRFENLHLRLNADKLTDASS
jgi:hypothetical protein